MMKLLKTKLKYTSRWIIFVIDVCFSLAAGIGAVLIIRNFSLQGPGWERVWESIALVIGVRITGFLLAHSHSGIVRYTGIQDVGRIFLMLTTGEAAVLTFNTIWNYAAGEPFMPYSFALTEYGLMLFVMIISRLTFKFIYARITSSGKPSKGVVIYGSDEYARMMIKVLNNSVDTKYKVKAFIDTDTKLGITGKQIAGISVYHLSSLNDLLQRKGVDLIIIAQKLVPPEIKSDIAEIALPHGVAVSEIPNFEKLIDGTLTVNQIRSIKIEDLLNRRVIELDNKAINSQLDGRTILVTGAAGSIGSELVRQLSHFRPRRVILYDIAESPLYELELEVRENGWFESFQVELGDIRDRTHIESVFNRHRPDVVYHAAAYKHVPMIENLPMEGIKTNVLGTRNVADAAVKYGCDRFVMVSTDKAVNPTNVMGCTKRIAEIYIQSLNVTTSTRFITTRFGNVLGSNGSVIPRFAHQIEAGGPVTVTHPEVTRFFMTIPEACQLVLQAGALGEGGEIFVFDMGKSVRISDLARNMIHLSGLEAGKDIQIIYTGLRPGEKLYEEVLDQDEHLLPTPHKLIFRAKVRDYAHAEVAEWLKRVEISATSGNSFKAIRIMKEMVPEYQSKNSVYEQIDALLREESVTADK